MWRAGRRRRLTRATPDRPRGPMVRGRGYTWLLLVAALLLGTVEGCGRGETPGGDPGRMGGRSPRGRDHPADSVPRDGGVLRVPISSDPGSMNPLAARGRAQAEFWGAFYPSLLVARAQGAQPPAVTGDLARSWRWDPEQRLLVCALRHDRLWEDTTRVSIGDVVRSYAAYRAVGWMNRRAPGDSLPDAGLVSVTAHGDSTVELAFAPGFSFWRALSAATWPILPERRLTDLSPSMLVSSPLAREPLSAGPFRLADWRPGLNLWLDPNPLAGSTRRAHLERIAFEVCPGIDARILRLGYGKADLVFDVPVHRLDELLDPGADVALHLGGVASVEVLLWSQRGVPAAPEIREAISLAIDRERAVRELLSWRDEVCGGPAGGLLEPSGPPPDSIEIAEATPAPPVSDPSAVEETTQPGPIDSSDADTSADSSAVEWTMQAGPIDSSGADSSAVSLTGWAVPVWPVAPADSGRADTSSTIAPRPRVVRYVPMPVYDRAAANQVLDAAGWIERDEEGFRTRGGLRLRLEVLYDRGNLFRERLATRLEEDLAAVGIELVPVPLDSRSLWSRFQAGHFEGVLLGFRPPVTPDLAPLWASWGAYNRTGYSSVRVDSLCAALVREESPVTVTRIARQIESIVRRSGPATFLVWRAWTALVGPQVRAYDGTAEEPLLHLERVWMADTTARRER